MTEFLPDYLIRQQAAVGALVLFGVLRVIFAAVAYERGWRIAIVELEGKAAGCAIALFCAPILGHRLGFE
jgi:hypothetical protein